MWLSNISGDGAGGLDAPGGITIKSPWVRPVNIWYLSCYEFNCLNDGKLQSTNCSVLFVKKLAVLLLFCLLLNKPSCFRSKLQIYTTAIEKCTPYIMSYFVWNGAVRSSGGRALCCKGMNRPDGGSILYGRNICSLGYFPFQLVVHNSSIQGCVWLVQSCLWESVYTKSLATYWKE